MKKVFQCKQCHKKFYTFEGAYIHCVRAHKHWGNIKYLFRFGIVAKMFKGVLLGIKYLFMAICFPFHWVFEVLESL